MKEYRPKKILSNTSGPLIWWKHWILWYCCWCLAKRYIITGFVHNLPQINENGFTLKKFRSRPYPAETMTDADYADDLVLLTNTSAQAESLLYNLEQEPEALTSMWTQIRRSSLTLNKKELFPLWWYYLPTPPLGQDMTQGQFLSGV